MSSSMSVCLDSACTEREENMQRNNCGKEESIFFSFRCEFPFFFLLLPLLGFCFERASVFPQYLLLLRLLTHILTGGKAFSPILPLFLCVINPRVEEEGSFFARSPPPSLFPPLQTFSGKKKEEEDSVCVEPYGVSCHIIEEPLPRQIQARILLI